jgi:hypothetical protein
VRAFICRGFPAWRSATRHPFGALTQRCAPTGRSVHDGWPPRRDTPPPDGAGSLLAPRATPPPDAPRTPRPAHRRGPRGLDRIGRLRSTVVSAPAPSPLQRRRQRALDAQAWRWAALAGPCRRWLTTALAGSSAREMTHCPPVRTAVRRAASEVEGVVLGPLQHPLLCCLPPLPAANAAPRLTGASANGANHLRVGGRRARETPSAPTCAPPRSGEPTVRTAALRAFLGGRPTDRPFAGPYGHAGEPTSEARS